MNPNAISVDISSLYEYINLYKNTVIANVININTIGWPDNKENAAPSF